MQRGTLAKLLALTVLLAAGLALHGAAREDQKEKEKDEKKGKKDKKEVPDGPALVVIDAAGKEQKLTNARFKMGTRRLAWLASGKDKGPEAMVLRAQKQIFYVAGVETLVPLDRLRQIDFDYKTELFTARVAIDSEEDEVVLKGAIGYAKLNRIQIEAEVDKGEAGVASFTYQGGLPKAGIRGLRFPASKVAPLPAGRPAVVKTLDKTARATEVVHDLQALYQFSDGERLLPTLMFKKTLKVDLTKVKKIVATSSDKDEDTVWEVTQGDDSSSLTLLTKAPVGTGGRTGTLVGLLGRVHYGYKLFPPRRIEEIHFDAREEPKEKDKDKDKDKGKDKEKKKDREKLEAARR